MIRPYKQQDKQELFKVFYLNTPKYFDRTEANDFEKFLQQYKDTYFVIEENHKIIGGCGFYKTNNEGHISWIFLHPDSQGKGGGKKIVEYCLKNLEDDSSIEIIIVETSQHAYKFFNAFGFDIVKKEKDYWAKGLDLYRMEMSRK